MRGDGDHPVVMQVTYPKGEISKTFNSWFRAEAGMSNGKAGCLQYAVRFEPGFDFVKGGKLPGLFGGDAPSGGKKVTGYNGFTTRYMWRRNGVGELYGYFVNKHEPKFGESVRRRSFRFWPGTWTLLEQEVIMNDPDKANGILRVWVDGEQFIAADDIACRATKSIGVSGLYFSTFFGGGDLSWAPDKDEYVQFADFRLYAQ